jgi:hypothetical protein
LRVPRELGFAPPGLGDRFEPAEGSPAPQMSD